MIVATRAEDGFAARAEASRQRVTPRTRAIVLNKPSNPTGAVLGRRDSRRSPSVVVGNDLLVISDDIYRQLVYGGARYVSIATAAPELAATRRSSSTACRRPTR